jgi:enhancing lycopene biosynthesis protein 2
MRIFNSNFTARKNTFMKVGVLLAGCGVYDGSEIHESVFTLLALAENGAESICMAPDINQHHVINHIDGSEMAEQRNVLIESARIARGNIVALSTIKSDDIDALVIPGGFGAAKNLNKWAFSGPDGAIEPAVADLIKAMLAAKKPIAGLCMGPTVIAKALENNNLNAKLTVGSTEAASPYDIGGISAGMESIGAIATMKTIGEIEVDEKLNIVTAPCYMMEASIVEVRKNIQQAIEQLLKMVKK